MAPRPDSPAPDEASHWYVRVREGLDATEAAAYLKWLDADPANREAFERLDATWLDLGPFGSSAEVLTLRREAVGNIHRGAHTRRTRFSLYIKAAAAAVILLAVGTGLVLWSLPPSEQSYQAPLGERRNVVLADGSTVALDQGSQVKVVYRPLSRELQLVRGQAEFHVAKNAMRPFSVEAAGERVVATGTVFNVDLLSRRVIVTLIEGHVRVSEPAAIGRAAIELNPLQKLTLDLSTGLFGLSRVDADGIEAWKQGKLVFEDEPLENAIERENRYAEHKIVLVAPAMASSPIKGVFRVGDSRAFAEAVADEFALHMTTSFAGDMVLSASQPPKLSKLR
jgi:transmembrane sensor